MVNLATGMVATGGVVSDYVEPGPGNVYRAHVFSSTGTFQVTSVGGFGASVDWISALLEAVAALAGSNLAVVVLVDLELVCLKFLVDQELQQSQHSLLLLLHIQ